MARIAAIFLLFLASALPLAAQTPAPGPAARPGWVTRMLHPFRAAPATPAYGDPKLRGLVLAVELAAQPVKLSEVRQLAVHATLTNFAKHPIELDFPTAQRIEIYLRGSSDKVLTKWSENRAFAEELGTVLINPREQAVYDETIATRELSPNKVYSVEVFFPKYPELRVRQKFLTAL